MHSSFPEDLKRAWRPPTSYLGDNEGKDFAPGSFETVRKKLVDRFGCGVGGGYRRVLEARFRPEHVLARAWKVEDL